MYLEPNKILKYLETLEPVGYKRRQKIAWAIIRQYDNIFGIWWEKIDRKYVLSGLNAIENHKFITIYRKNYGKKISDTTRNRRLSQ